MTDEAGSARDRVFTWPLVVFLAAVAAVLTIGLATRHPRPDLLGAARLLADGDFDRDERNRMLARVIELARGEGEDAALASWAGGLAAIALMDEQAYAEFAARRLASEQQPTAEQLRWLDLGDPVLANILEAWRFELTGQAERVKAEWRQVAAQATLTGNRLAARLAADAAPR